MAYSYNFDGGAGKSNTRKEPRVSTPPIAVKIKGECQRLYGYARDVSTSGMQLRTFMFCSPEPKKQGEKIHIEFELPEAGVNFECDATVVWNSMPEEGPRTLNLQGVLFDSLDDAARRKLSDWVDSERRRP